jgi:hypothetical protein
MYCVSQFLLTFSESQPMEYMPMDETYSAVIHRINHAIKWRASHPSEPISEPYPVLTKFSNPPAALMVKASPILERLAAVADVKKGKGLLLCSGSMLIDNSPTQSQRSKIQAG